jgi:HTH-type transcriptional regulator / antitoxin HipB
LNIIPFGIIIPTNSLVFPIGNTDTAYMGIVVHSAADIGTAARTRRRALGYTQAEVASLCATGVRFISDFENGKATIELGKALVVLTALGLDISLAVRGEA